jgi:pimeloyl-ACP methyl ester carboxylesterase
VGGTRLGSPNDDPVLLVHGIMSDAGVFWRLGPALAAAGHRVLAMDMPAHGATGPWRGRYALAETAADLAALIRSLDLDADTLSVLGHSWGGMVVAGLPIAGIRPRKLILLDPPYLELDDLVALTQDPIERHCDSVEEARGRLNATQPEWAPGDVEAKARALTRSTPKPSIRFSAGTGAGTPASTCSRSRHPPAYPSGTSEANHTSAG